MFGNYLKQVEKQFSNFLYLAYCERVISIKKINEKQFLKISHTFSRKII